MRFYVLTMLMVIMGLCLVWGAGTTEAAPPAQVDPGAPFILLAGQQATLEDGALIVFDRVLEDSRCPATAECFTAGSVRVQISLDGNAHILTLGDQQPGDSSSVQMSNGMTLELRAVDPYPGSRADTPDAADSVELVVGD